MIKRINKYVTPADKDYEREETSSLEEGYESDEEELAGPVEIHESKHKEKSPHLNFNFEDSERNLLNRKTEREEKTNLKHKVIHTCEICTKILKSELELSQHLNSKSHIKILKQKTKDELKEAGSLRNFLIEKGFISRRKNNYNKIKTLLYFNSLCKMLKSS